MERTPQKTRWCLFSSAGAMGAAAAADAESKFLDCPSRSIADFGAAVAAWHVLMERALRVM